MTFSFCLNAFAKSHKKLHPRHFFILEALFMPPLTLGIFTAVIIMVHLMASPKTSIHLFDLFKYSLILTVSSFAKILFSSHIDDVNIFRVAFRFF